MGWADTSAVAKVAKPEDSDCAGLRGLSLGIPIDPARNYGKYVTDLESGWSS
jgi:hypothetical protein